MNAAASDREACAAISLALAFYRTPALHADLLHGKVLLPGAIGTLLRAALADKSESEAGASTGELRKAALFFVEQVMFRHGANHFRVLGVNPDAGLEQIKEHHRLLMRLFHPDREQSGNRNFDAEWSAACAARVNLAYNTLRDADSRRRYIALLNAQPARQTAEMAYSSARPRWLVRQPDSFWRLHVAPFASRYLPQMVLGWTAVLGGLLVLAGVYFSNPTFRVADTDMQNPLPHTQLPVVMSPTENPVVEEAKLQAMQLDESIARFVRTERMPMINEIGHAQSAPQPKKPNVAPVVVTQAAVRSVAGKVVAPYRAVSPGASVWVATQNTHTNKMQLASAAVLPLMPSVSPAPSVPREFLSSGATAKQPAEMAIPVAVAENAQVAQNAEGLVIWEPHPMLSRLIEVYELGDVQALMMLFDEGVQTRAGNWSETRRDYETVFRNTELRDLRIEGMSWYPEGAVLKGQGRYRLTHMHKGETKLKTQSGMLRMELVRRGRSVLISGLYYLGENP